VTTLEVLYRFLYECVLYRQFTGWFMGSFEWQCYLNKKVLMEVFPMNWCHVMKRQTSCIEKKGWVVEFQWFQETTTTSPFFGIVKLKNWGLIADRAVD
jgi:hypothetical protein